MSEIVKGAEDAKQALRVFEGLSEGERGERFFRPVVSFLFLGGFGGGGENG